MASEVKSPKRSKKTASKPVTKRRNKPARRFKAISRKIRRLRTKYRRLARKQNKLLHKRMRKISKRLHRHAHISSKKSKKPARNTARKNKRTYRPRTVIALLVTALLAGTVIGQQLKANGYATIFSSNKKTEAPGKITSFGPKQSNTQFSTYPTWSQNFQKASGQPDKHYWNIFQGEPPNDNQEAQYYTANSNNVHIKNGVLSLIATHESQPKGYQYASARIDTQNKFSFLYGRVDVSAKLPSGVGTWPAIWFLPNNTKYEDMGASDDPVRYINGGEMDMAEAVGFNPNVVYGVVHTRTDLNNPDRIGAFNQVTVPGNNTGYNTYTVLWTPSTITYEVNNTPFFTYTRSANADYTTWPFDQPFYMIVNLAMGGNWGGEDTTEFPGNGIDNSVLPASLDIKSIYYYSYVGTR